MKNQSERISSEYANALDGGTKSLVKSTGKARFADYSEKELMELPANISEHSFGCGNPLAFSKVQKGQTVLDLGCGAGLDLLLAAKVVGSEGRVIGVDMTDDMLKKAQQNIDASEYSNIELKKGKIENLPVKSNSIDWVISNCVINLSAEKEQAFSEIVRVLKPEGEILISDIVAENMPWWVRKSGLLTAACVGGAIPEKDYLNKLRIAGLSECTVVTRQYYEPSQMASSVVEVLPSTIAKLSCCGKSIVRGLLTKLAAPIAKNLWSAKFSAKITANPLLKGD
ncbi:MAG: methyltransferase domain-containing protein [Thiotrichaceae bacterium]